MNFSTLPVLSYEEAETWLSGKAGKVQEEVGYALEAVAGDTEADDGDTMADTLKELLTDESIRNLDSEGHLQESLEELLAKYENQPSSQPSDDDYVPDIRLHEGDLVIDNLELTCDCLIVNGNLKVTGLMESAQPAEYGALIVLGDASVGRYLSSNTHTVIRGNLRAQHIATGSGNDCAFVVGGDAEIESFAEFGEYAHIHGHLKARWLISLMNRIQADGGCETQNFHNYPQEILDLPALLRSELIVATPDNPQCEFDIDEDAYCECLQDNISPFRE
jgi:hypothetical protein